MKEFGIFLVNQNSGEKLPLRSDAVNIIGRGLDAGENPEATILLPHPAVSKCHASIFLDQDSQQWRLHNFSRYGTSVNNSYVNEVRVRHGDSIGIGPYQLVFYEKFFEDGTVEHNIGGYNASQWEEEELTPMGSLLETIAIIAVLVLSGVILLLCFIR